ncbi:MULTISPECIES: SGNH/GDSL hydrolase family protein [unclassified Paraburkholderia]|uniref:SGNH/GDSL hydrolase family protein n=1 Tax=unclassified Paraburkholderia TaxID=2615204 RepID=UPI002AB16B03|nr:MULTISPECIES: SGNH/GDSL hydrolase family protein [unclassified Paraburkholderia]
MRTVLCYGDSNTYGTKPMTSIADDFVRFDRETRWPGVLRKQLGDQWEVIEEGLASRTTVHDDPIEGAHKNGARFLQACLESHAPIDLVILMLGTNDLKTRFGVTGADIGYSLAALLAVIGRSNVGPEGRQPQALVLAPPVIREVGFLGEIFEGGSTKSLALARGMAKSASDAGAAFLDASQVVQVSDIDGVHLDAEGHFKLGTHVAEKLSCMSFR